jgi:hypothetical protein
MGNGKEVAMKRLLCISALAAVVLVPDWASACWRRWGGPVYRQSYYCAPTYRAPVYYAAAPVCYPAPPVYCQPAYPPPVYAQPWVPAPAFVPQVPAVPAVQPVKPSSDNSRAAPPTPSVARPEPAPPSAQPLPEPVIPASDLSPAKPPEPVKPQPEPARDPARPKGPKVSVEPPAKPNPPAPADKPKPEELKFPAVEPPSIPSVKPKGSASAGVNEPTLELPKDSKIPPLEVTGSSAVPVPAPSSDVLIPPAGVPGAKADSLPPLALPPDSPVAPGAVEAKSSPLGTATTALKVSVFPAVGAAAGQYRKVGFYNHTTRDLALTIEGRAVTLPAKSYLFAQLPASFSWACAGKPAAKETIPADATGLDVLIRE